MYCSPSRENMALSCYNDSELKKIYTDAFGNMETVSRKTMIDSLTKYFKNECKKKDQTCWTSDPELIQKVFRPLHTWSKNGWLSDEDIDNVLSQYEKSREDYVHLGTERVDFWYRKTNDLKHKKFGPLVDAGKTKFSLVILLYGYRKESYYQEHWVTIYIDLKKGQIDYFDSSNFDIIPAMEFLLFEIQLQLTLLTGNTDFRTNKSTFPLQKYDGDCGVFAVDFTVRRLAGMTFQGYMEYHRMLDLPQQKYMKIMRTYYFR